MRISDWSSDVCSSDLLLPPETRRLAREVWGLKIVDMYSTQEIGYLAFQCPQHDHYHVQAEAALVEVLNEAGESCRPGAIGQVVTTPPIGRATCMERVGQKV